MKSRLRIDILQKMKGIRYSLHGMESNKGVY